MLSRHGRKDIRSKVFPDILSLVANFTSVFLDLLAGGLGGIGRSISRWLIAHGARNLIIVSRSGPSSQSASSFLAQLESADIRTAVVKCDISDFASLSTALANTLKSFPPIKGVIQGAMVISDSLFGNMTLDHWNKAIKPKVQGSKNLHKVTFEQPLEFFILLSSLHSFTGNPGQTNYTAGCAYQVALAKHRNGLGLPATAIDLGIVDDVGYIVERQEVGEKVRIHDWKHIKEQEMLALVELAIREPFMGHLVTGLDSENPISRTDDSAPFYAQDPVLSHLDYLRPHLQSTPITHLTSSDPSSSNLPPLSVQLASATSLKESTTAIQAALLRKLSRSFMMNPSDIDPTSPMSAYGTDSLVAVDIRNWIKRETKATVSVFNIIQAPSVTKLVEQVVERL
jgi:hypothetical protein